MQKSVFLLLVLFFFSTRLEAFQQNPHLRMVKAKGHRLSMHIEGKGLPIIVFESGLGGVKKDWHKVQKQVAKFAKTVSYDRAGLAQSEASTTPRTAAERAEDLHTALQNAKLKPPYILVGHSAGGPYIRIFAGLYPKEVAGMVFVDASHEDFFEQLKEQLPKDWKKYELVVSRGIKNKELSVEVRDELRSFEGDLKLAKDSWPLPDVPVISLTAMKHPEVSRKALEIWIATQEAWTKRFTHGKHIHALNSGHEIHEDEPALVINAIRQVIVSVRKR
ncbi:MAG: alpha/beta fold hydrolase [Bacteroidota bacterium]